MRALDFAQIPFLGLILSACISAPPASPGEGGYYIGGDVPPILSSKTV